MGVLFYLTILMINQTFDYTFELPENLGDKKYDLRAMFPTTSHPPKNTIEKAEEYPPIIFKEEEIENKKEKIKLESTKHITSMCND